MSLVEGHERRGRKRLVKRRKPQRHTSMQFPDRLGYGDDAQDDVTAADGRTAHYANQSVFSMIAAAGSRTNFHARFEDDSSDSEGDQCLPRNTAKAASHAVPAPNPIPHGAEEVHHGGRREEDGRHAGPTQITHHTLALPKLHIRTSKEKRYGSQSSNLSSIHYASAADGPQQMTPRDAPVMSQMLAAKARLEPMAEHSLEQPNPDAVVFPTSPASPVTLADRLMEIFAFEMPEEVISGM